MEKSVEKEEMEGGVLGRGKRLSSGAEAQFVQPFAQGLKPLPPKEQKNRVAGHNAAKDYNDQRGHPPKKSLMAIDSVS